MRELVEIINNMNNTTMMLKDNIKEMLDIIDLQNEQVLELRNRIYEIEKKMESHDWDSFFIDEVYWFDSRNLQVL